MGKVLDLCLFALKSHLGGAHTLASEAYALAREQHLALDDVDHEVLIDRLLLANRHLGLLLWATTDDDWGDSSPVRVAELARRYRPFVRFRADPRDYLVRLVNTAARRARQAHRMLAAKRPDSKSARSAWAAAAHLEVAQIVLGGGGRHERFIIESLDEHRQIVREQHRPPGGDLSAV